MAKYNHDESLTENAERGVDITEPPVRYFEVEKETLSGKIWRGIVNRDGSEYEIPYDAEETREITTGFSVRELDEYGITQDVEFYEVKTNFNDFSNNEAEVLDKIEADHPAGEWQCHNW